VVGDGLRISGLWRTGIGKMLRRRRPYGCFVVSGAVEREGTKMGHFSYRSSRRRRGERVMNEVEGWFGLRVVLGSSGPWAGLVGTRAPLGWCRWSGSASGLGHS